MAKKPQETYEPPSAGPLQLRSLVRTHLFGLSHLMDVSLASLSPPRKLPPAELDIALVIDVERDLKCSLPDEVLACFANRDDVLTEWGFCLENIAEHTEFARRHGCGKDSIAIGCQPDSMSVICISRNRPRVRAVQIEEIDVQDRSSKWHDLGEWLAQRFESRREFLTEEHSELASWTADPLEVEGWSPMLVEVE